MPERMEELPGVEGKGVSPVKVKAITDAFDDLVSAREKRMDWAKREGDAQKKLIQLFHKHELEVYYYNDRKYMLKDIEKVVLAPKDEDESDD